MSTAALDTSATCVHDDMSTWEEMGTCAPHTLNDHLREHTNNIHNGKDGFLAQHCRSCMRSPVFEGTITLYRHGYDCTRIIFEAAQVAYEHCLCMSKLSLSLSDKDLSFLGSTGAHIR